MMIMMIVMIMLMIIIMMMMKMITIMMIMILIFTLAGGMKRFSCLSVLLQLNNSSFDVLLPVNILCCCCCFDVLLNISSCSFRVLFAAKWFRSLASGRGGEGVSGSKGRGEISAIFITFEEKF